MTNPNDLIRLTHQQKLEAISLRFYQGIKWTPKPGDYYTTSRADLELYQVVAVEGGQVKTRYCDTGKSTVISSWPVEEFLDAGFGPKRVWVPEFVLSINAIPAAIITAVNEEQNTEQCKVFWNWLPLAYRDGHLGEEPKFTKYNMEVAHYAGWKSASDAPEVLALVEAMNAIDALDPEGMIEGCSQSALCGLVLRMGEIARAAIAAWEASRA